MQAVSFIDIILLTLRVLVSSWNDGWTSISTARWPSFATSPSRTNHTRDLLLSAKKELNLRRNAACLASARPLFTLSTSLNLTLPRNQRSLIPSTRPFPGNPMLWCVIVTVYPTTHLFLNEEQNSRTQFMRFILLKSAQIETHFQGAFRIHLTQLIRLHANTSTDWNPASN